MKASINILCVWLIAMSAIIANATTFMELAQARESAAVKTATEEWTDGERGRTVPVKLYYQPGASAPMPVVIFSHGLGGSREAARYLGESWAKDGFFCVFVQHPGSDQSLWKGMNDMGQIRQALSGGINFQSIKDRVDDIHFVLNRLDSLNAKGSPYAGLADPGRVGMAGHSFGAWTSLAIAGQSFGGPLMGSKNFSDPRIKAAIYLSPPPYRGRRSPQEAFGSIKIPGMLITGSQDTDPITNGEPEKRAEIFNYLQGPGQYLLYFDQAAHQTFGGRKRQGSMSELDERIEGQVAAVTSKFWEAYLRGDDGSRSWLAQGSLSRSLGATARVSLK